MAYIGRPLNAGNLAVQSGTGDGSDTTPIATLDYSVGSSNSIAVYLDGVRQLAGTDFTAAGTALTFTTAPANGVGIDVYFLGLELSIPTPADATVAKAKITTTLINEHVDTTITASDSILFADATDSNANKKDTVQGILDLVSGANTDLSNVSATGENKIAQAWVAFNGSGTLAVLDSGGHTGVSSVTDNGTGDYSVTLASALGNANYAIAGSVTCSDGASGQRALEISSTNLPTTTVVRLFTSYVHATANRTKVDEVHISIVVFGD